MKTKTIATSTPSAVHTKKQRSYAEVVDFLDANWKTNLDDASLSKLTKLDQAFGSVSKKIPTIVVGGTNGKSLTIGFTAKLLREENLTVGTFIAPHVLTYNERFSLNNTTIANKAFTDVANEVITTAESMGLALNSIELLTMMALVYFAEQKVDVAIIEAQESGLPCTTKLLNPTVVGITRIAEGSSPALNKADADMIRSFLHSVKQKSHVVSADQSKLNLQSMQELVEAVGGVWEMPIRKLAALPRPFEQLHGRCAALAERIATIFVNEIVNQNSVTITETLLTRIKGQRGRPTLEAKRRSELNPKKTLEQFWKDTVNELPGRFELLEKEKPFVLLDNAANLDAIRNLLLGIRLLHYQRPLKGLAIVLGNNNPDIDTVELLKLIRYFFKKSSGSLVICPSTPSAENINGRSWDAEAIAHELKNMKVKARAASSFAEALSIAKSSVDERQGLIAISGSQEMVSAYWHTKGIKKV
jgi:folylpolyglutamate synthase/dihydropteroate synthase